MTDPAATLQPTAHADPGRTPVNDIQMTADRVDFPPEPATQGDVMLLPWLEATAPTLRAERAAATVPIDPDGTPIDENGRTHVLRADGGGLAAGIRYGHVGKGNTIGTLVVADGHTARLTYPDYPDVTVGPGVYVVHRQPQPRQTPRPPTRRDPRLMGDHLRLRLAGRPHTDAHYLVLWRDDDGHVRACIEDEQGGRLTPEAPGGWVVEDELGLSRLAVWSRNELRR